jgi:hypothetical protein
MPTRSQSRGGSIRAGGLDVVRDGPEPSSTPAIASPDEPLRIGSRGCGSDRPSRLFRRVVRPIVPLRGPLVVGPGRTASGSDCLHLDASLSREVGIADHFRRLNPILRIKKPSHQPSVLPEAGACDPRIDEMQRVILLALCFEKTRSKDIGRSGRVAPRQFVCRGSLVGSLLKFPVRI